MRFIIGLIPLVILIGPEPARSHGCGHHAHYLGDCWDCGWRHVQPSEQPRPRWQGQPPSPAASLPRLETLEGNVAEVIYLQGAGPDAAMVEIEIRSAGQDTLVRLAPTGFLRQNEFLIKEGDMIAVKGFRVSTFEGDLLVATEVRKDGNTLVLREARGRPAW